MLFLVSLMLWYDISVLLHYEVTTLLTHFFCSSQILKSFKAKPQSKSIQWFNFSYTGKTNRKSETNIIANFIQFFDNYDVFLLVWRHKIISFLSKQLFFQFLMKNYCFNTFSSPGLGLKLQKFAFKIWWRHKPPFAIDWKHCLWRILKKHIDYKRFNPFALSSRH